MEERIFQLPATIPIWVESTLVEDTMIENWPLIK